MDAMFEHDDVYCSYQVECMYIHYELFILRFYEACLGLEGFSMLGLNADHGQRIWIVTPLIPKSIEKVKEKYLHTTFRTKN